MKYSCEAWENRQLFAKTFVILILKVIIYHCCVDSLLSVAFQFGIKAFGCDLFIVTFYVMHLNKYTRWKIMHKQTLMHQRNDLSWISSSSTCLSTWWFNSATAKIEVLIVHCMYFCEKKKKKPQRRRMRRRGECQGLLGFVWNSGFLLSFVG